MARSVPKERKPDMYKAILELNDLQQCMDFFEDICSMTELQAIEQRFEVAKMLYENNIYTDIQRKTNASTATISRVSRLLNYGTGSLVSVLEHMHQEQENDASEEASK